MLYLLKVIWRGEPWGHIKDSFGLAIGKLVVCGKPPNTYLMHKKYLVRAAVAGAEKGREGK